MQNVEALRREAAAKLIISVAQISPNKEGAVDLDVVLPAIDAIATYSVGLAAKKLDQLIIKLVDQHKAERDAERQRSANRQPES